MLLPAGLLVPAPVQAAPQAQSASACPDVLDYGAWKEAEAQLWDFRSPALTIIGAEHSRDPSHAQFARIESEFAAARPSLVFFEGPDRGIGDSADEAIRNGGESAFVRLLARKAGIPARGLEPSPGEQVQALAEHYPLDQVLLFFVVREAVRLRDREGRTGDALAASVAALLERVSAMASSSGIALPFDDVAGLQAAFEAYWPRRDWKSADSDWFSPLADDAQTGGRFFAAINRADSTNRNRHMVKLFADAVRQGERPFVVVGRNHVPMLSPALACLLRDPPDAASR